ncbi:hypothetical protein EI94DRAFT_1310029 [Lactarius quietus]|nr:hypothetical protein EI94DRAFT_1310029 [Lactarius quietus]
MHCLSSSLGQDFPKHNHREYIMPRGQLLLFTRPAESPLQSYPFPSPQLAAYPSSYTIISGVMSGPPLDASGVLTLKLLHFLANQRPSAQEKRGDWRLDNARQLARDNETVISPGDLEIVKERITLATEIKMGLESKRGLTRYLQAREYRKASKETLKRSQTERETLRWDKTWGYQIMMPCLYSAQGGYYPTSMLFLYHRRSKALSR